MDNYSMKNSFMWIDPERMSGTPCFHGTRVPVKTLFDYLEGGSPLTEFLEDFPTVGRQQAEEAVAAAGKRLVAELVAIPS
jgi:uncharacterized protein (DUF433 family)